MNPGAYVPGKVSSGRRDLRKGFRWGRWLLLVFFGLGLMWGGYLHWRYQALRREIADLQVRNAALAEKIEALKKNPALYEEIARKKYGYVKKNERLIIFGKGR
ncbi:septum formation initiator family protein [Thermosulfurimonas sp.]|uniref:FtsB family cell division protein n=1 Tax=Thermosulfurimonas sp. TaxID=2080236 RepID=UPI0025E80148|nr:septum formation initiator family protein [Thermosulfurimonas sp.]